MILFATLERGRLHRLWPGWQCSPACYRDLDEKKVRGRVREAFAWPMAASLSARRLSIVGNLLWMLPF